MADIPIPKPNEHSESSLTRTVGDNKYTNKSSVISESKNKVQLKGGVTKKNPSFGEKIKRSFVKEDVKDIRDYIVFDVVIPSIRNAIFNTIVGAAGQIFGVSVPSNVFRYSNGYNGGSKTRLTPHERQFRDYNSIQRENRTVVPIEQYSRFYVGDYSFAYKEDAESVLEQLMDICDTYGWVSVSKFFELADPDGTISGKNAYTNNNYGWYAIDNATVMFDGSGYVINLPPAKPKR